MTPAPGLQSGTYPIQIIAQSTTDPDLEAQSIAYVTIKPTTNGITLAVAPDPLITVPFNGTELPTAFNVTLQNMGPSSLTQTLTISNVPAGFTVLTSATSVTVPAGDTGIVGVYLVPTGQIPAPGTVLTFTVSTGPYLLASKTETFTVPEIYGVTLTSDPPSQDATPGSTATDRLTINNVGNVPEVVTLSSAATSGLAVAGLSGLTLQPGQSAVEAITLTPAASTPLNSFLAATFTATYGPAGSPLTTTLQLPVDVVVPGALAIAQASASATQLGETGLANRLNDLGLALTNVVQNPTNPVYASQAVNSLDAIIKLLAADVYLVPLGMTLAADRAALAQATTTAAILAAVTTIGNDLGAIATTLTDEIGHSLTIQLAPNQGQALPQVPVLYRIDLHNTGTRATTYDLTVSGLPPGVSASFNHTSATLQPGQDLFGGPDGIVLTLVETGGAVVPASFAVTASAEGSPEINRAAVGSLTVRQAFLEVVSVTPSASFVNPGGLVDVSTRILNITPNPYTAQAFFTVSGPSGSVVFMSPQLAVPFSPFSSYPIVDLGKFDTTGFAVGTYTIRVFVVDGFGNPLTNVPGIGSVLVGTPLAASLKNSTTGYFSPNFPYTQRTTNTLTVSARTTFPSPLTLAGFTATDASETDVALSGTVAYVCGTKDVSIIDVHDPSNPTVLGTFGSDVVTPGGLNIARISGNLLLVASQNTLNANFFNLLIYSIADPLSPTLVSETPINYHFISDMFIRGTTAYFPIGGISTFVGVILTDQYGDFLSVDFSNPSKPKLSDVLFNNRGAPDGGDNPENGVAVINNQLTYVASTTSSGSDSTVGTGELLIVNTSAPANLAVAGTLLIPGTVQLVGIAIDGNRALVVGSTGGTVDNGSLSSVVLSGTLTLTMLDISDPLHPRIIGTPLATQDTFSSYGDNQSGAGKFDVFSIGHGIFAISNTKLNGKPVILLADASDPAHMIVGPAQTSSLVNGLTVSGNLLYAAGQDGLSIYNIGQVLGIPIVVSANVPTGTDVTYDPKTFNIAPSQIVHGTGFDTITWVTSLGALANSVSFTWSSNLAANRPTGTYPVTLGATIDFIDQGTPGTLILPGTSVNVSSSSFLFASPASITVAPGATANYTVSIQRSTADTYTVGIAGLPASWSTAPFTVTTVSGRYLDVPLKIVPDPATPAGTYNFTVVVTDGQLTDSYQLTLIVQGQSNPLAIDANSHGVVASLIPIQPIAGQGTSARYTVRLTNTGSADESFNLAASGLPVGVTASFGQATIDVSPGTSNYRDVTLTLATQPGTTPGNYTFSVTATSTTTPSATSTTGGTLTVLATGVSVSLNPPSRAPGSAFQLTVTNTGQVTDTFTLALGGPAALVASLGLGRVTLAPGASQVIPITTNGVNFAVPGGLTFMASATSQANPAVQAAADGSLTIPTFSGLTAQFSPSVQTIAGPGSASFLLDVNNTGNAEDSYEAIILGTSGPVTASLTGLDGSPTDEIPLFRLPGLSTGAILLQAAISALGQGTVTVEIVSLTDGSIVATATATINALAAPTITLTPSNASPTYGQSVNFTTTVAAATAGDPVPTGTAQFAVDGVDFGAAIALVNGAATSPGIATLAAGQHTIIVNYGGDSTYGPDSQTYTLTVAPVRLTITATDATKVTGQANPTFSATYSGFVLGQGPGDLAGTLTFSTTATAASPPGNYAIVSGGLSSANYSITFDNGTLAVTHEGSTVVVAPSSSNPTYGQLLTFVAHVSAATSSPSAPSGTVQFEVDGVPLGTPVTLVDGSATSPAIDDLAAGSHPITASYSGDADFAAGMAPVTTSTVAKASLTVAARDATKAAGQANPAFSASYSGFVLGQSAANLAGTLAFSTAATANIAPGQYAVTPGGLSSGNYKITFVPGTLTVTASTLTGTAIAVAPSSPGLTYGQTVTLYADVASSVPGQAPPTGTVQFLIDGVAFGPAVALVGGAATSEAIATLGAGIHMISAAYSGDSTFAASTSAILDETVAKAPLTVAANDAVKVYGQANPALSASYAGFVLGQDAGSLAGSLSLATMATAASQVGSYPITAGGLTSPNYSITFVPGTFAVTPAPLTVSAPDLTVPYGSPIPALAATYSGFVNGDGPASLATQAVLATAATSISPAGSYTISAGGASSPDYAITYQNGLLTITAAASFTLDPGLSAFVTQLYREVLGREPEPTGLAYWLQQLATDETYAQVSKGFFASLERRTLQAEHRAPKITQPRALADALHAQVLADVAPAVLAEPGPLALVATLYRDILGRAPDARGLQTLLEELAIGTSPAKVAADLFDSPEHKLLKGEHEAPKFSERAALAVALKAEKAAAQAIVADPTGTSSPTSDQTMIAPSLESELTAFVTTLYREVLGRAPEPSGLANWLQALESGVTPAQATRDFFASPERAALQAEHKAPKISQPQALADALRSELFAEISAPVLAEPGPIALVTTLYRETLGRTPDSPGEQFWIDLLAIGTSPADIATEIHGSPEYAILRHQHKAPRITERAALADALKAEAKAIQVAVAYPTGPIGLS